MKTKIFLTIGLMYASTISAHAQQADQIKQTAIRGAQVAGGVARIAIEVCHVAPKLVDNYKELARKAFAADENFEGNWLIGWNNQQESVNDISKLQANSHDEYAIRKSETCARISNEMKL